MKRALELSLCLAALAASAGCGSSSSTPPRGHAEILSGLKVTEFANPPPATVTDASGREHVIADPDHAWQPLRKPVAVFGPRTKLLEVGALIDLPAGGQVASALWDDAATGYGRTTPLGTAEAPLDFRGARLGCAADVDGDGLDEVVLLTAPAAGGGAVRYRVFKGGAFGAEAPLAGMTYDPSDGVYLGDYSAALGSPWFPRWSCTRADVDGVGDAAAPRRERVVVANHDSVFLLSAAQAADGSWTVSFDPDKDEYPFAGPVASVAAGDLDGDGRDELAVGLLDGYALFRHPWIGITKPDVVSSPGLAGPVEVAFGDLRGNHLQQLVVAGSDAVNNSRAHALVYDFGADGHGLTQEVAKLTVAGNPMNVWSRHRLLPRAVDFGATGRAALVLLGAVFSDPLAAPTNDLPDLTLADYFPALGQMSLVDVQVGDVDGDQHQDMIVSSVGAYSGVQLHAFGWDLATTSQRLVSKGSFPTNLAADYTVGRAAYGVDTAFATGHFDDDAPRVRYVGHKLTFSDPIVIAVLASPMYFADVARADVGYQAAYPSWATMYGTSTANESSSAHSVAFSVGAQLDFEHEFETPLFGLKIGEVKASLAFKNTNTWEWSSSTTVTRTIQRYCYAGQDEVIFTAVPIDQYEYVILSSPNAEDADKIGRSLHINIPRAFSTYKVTRRFFNDNLGDLPKIDEAVLGHKIGDPFSYPTLVEKDQLLATYGGYATDVMTLAMGENGMPDPGPTTAQIDVASGTAKTVSHDFSVDTSVGAGVGDWTASVTAGFNTGYSATSSTTDTTSFLGTMGYLPEAYYSNPNYSIAGGFFVYPYRNAYGRTYWVTNYWWQR